MTVLKPEKGSDIKIKINGVIASGITQLKTLTDSNLYEITEILQDNPTAYVPLVKGYTLILSTVSNFNVDLEKMKDFTVSVISISGQAVYSGCQVKRITYLAQPQNPIQRVIEIKAQERTQEEF